MPYISRFQLEKSLDVLKGIHTFFGTVYLAFKSINIPIGSSRAVNFSKANNEILNRYYQIGSMSGFYSPFKTSDKNNRWQSPRYASTTLQRIAKDTFSDALVHPDQYSWGWSTDYVEALLRHLGGTPLPVFDLAVWLYKDEYIDENLTQELLVKRFLSDFYITEEELRLFEINIDESEWLYDEPMSIEELLDVVGRPDGSEPDRGAALSELVLNEIGPADHFIYEPSERLNIITGDNSLGKTFLLEAIWWSLTGEWAGDHLIPRSNVSKNTPYISFKVNIKGHLRSAKAAYDWQERDWKLSTSASAKPGLSIYARYDGSFVIWDPTKVIAGNSNKDRGYSQIILSESEVWHGKRSNDGRNWICNGIVRDWITWQVGGVRYQDRWNVFCSVLKTLSPIGERLEIGEPIKDLYSDAEQPTLRMSYGDIPAIGASAGVKRAVSLAYCMVWSWYRHLDLSAAIKNLPERRIILLLDEAEAHLHPKWQRTVIPSIISVMNQLFSQATPQLHIATHSPMIMASIEPLFNEEIDNLHNLKLEKDRVHLEELRFVKRGTADLWLMSDVFGLGQARSSEAEKAIADAKSVQMARRVDGSLVKEINSRLIKFLAPDDNFWPRWRSFALSHGVER